MLNFLKSLFVRLSVLEQTKRDIAQAEHFRNESSRKTLYHAHMVKYYDAEITRLKALAYREKDKHDKA